MERLRGCFALDQASPPTFAVHLRLNGELKTLLKEAMLSKLPVSLRLGHSTDKAILLVDGREYEFSTSQLSNTGLLRVPHLGKGMSESSPQTAALLCEVHKKLIIGEHHHKAGAALLTPAALRPHSSFKANQRAAAVEARPNITTPAAAPEALPASLPTAASSEKRPSSVVPLLPSHRSSAQAPKAAHALPAPEQRTAPPHTQKTSDAAPAQQQLPPQHQKPVGASAVIPSRPAPLKPAPAVLDSKTAMWAAMKGDLKLVVVAMLYEKPMPDMALNKAITSLYAEVRARPEAKEYIKRVVSEACELNMNRWRVREEVLFRELPRLLALNAQHAPPPDKPQPGKDKTGKANFKQQSSQDRPQAEQAAHQKSSPPLPQHGKKHKHRQQEGSQDRNEQPTTEQTDGAGAKKRRKTEVTASPERRPPVSSPPGDESAASAVPVHRKVLEKRAASASHNFNMNSSGQGRQLPSAGPSALRMGQQPAVGGDVPQPAAGQGEQQGLDLEDDDEDHPMIISRSVQGGNGNSRRNGGLQRQEKRTSPPVVGPPGASSGSQAAAAAALSAALLRGDSPDVERQAGAAPAGVLGNAPWVEHTNSPSPPSQSSPRDNPLTQGRQRVSGDGAGAQRRSDDGRGVGAVGLVREANATQHVLTAAAGIPGSIGEILVPELGSTIPKVKFDEDPEAGLYQEWVEQRVRPVEHINSPESFAAAEVRYGLLQALHFGLCQKITAAISEVEAWNTSFQSSSSATEKHTRATQVWEIGARKWPMMQNWSRAAENLQQVLQAIQSEVLRASPPTR